MAPKTTTHAKTNWGGARPNSGGSRPGAGRKRETIRLSIDDLAAAIYSDCFGHLDDKAFHDAKLTEIHDWLAGGDLPARPKLADLIAAWSDYDKDEPNLR